MKLKIKNIVIFISVAIIIMRTIQTHAHSIYLMPYLHYRQTTEKGIYNTQYGFGGGMALRYYTNNRRVYLQAGFNWDKQKVDDIKANKLSMSTLDWQVAFQPIKEKPFYLLLGTFKHFYKVNTNPIEVNGFLFLPASTDKYRIDGWDLGIGYQPNKWVDLRLIYEKEPFLLFDSKITANYVRLEANFVLKLGSWGSKENKTE